MGFPAREEWRATEPEQIFVFNFEFSLYLEPSSPVPRDWPSPLQMQQAGNGQLSWICFLFTLWPANREFGWTSLDCLNLLAFCLFNTKDKHEHLWGICLFQVLLDHPQSQFLFVPQELTAKLDWLGVINQKLRF